MSVTKHLVGRIRTKAVGDRQARVIATTPAPDRVSEVVSSAGMDAKNYLGDPIVLRDHDHTRPVGRCLALSPYPDRIEALLQFPPEGTSLDSDETYRLVKERVLNAVSIGFIPKKVTPLPGGGLRYDEWELLEISICAVPMNPQALIVERRAPGRAKRYSAATRAVLAKIDELLDPKYSEKRSARLLRVLEADRIRRDVDRLLEDTK
jgi:HK97 family phage prohead protease